MAVYSTNQNRQFYVVTSVGTVADNSNAGVVQLKTTGNPVDTQLFFLYKGADTVLRSDLIPAKNVNYVKLIEGSKMRVALKSVEVTLDSAVNGGDPVAGQDYILRINLRQFYGMSDQDQYFKDAAVHAYSGMTAEEFYTEMVDALNLAFSREVGATKASNPYLTFSADSNGITITEKEQPWSRDVEAQERVYFDVVPTTVFVGGDDVIWGKVEDISDVENAYLTNGKKMASLEWFLMGERGDQYRMMGYPNHIPTTYLVDPTKEYDALELHYAFTDTGVNSYRSEKDITLIAETGVLDTLYAAIQEALGIASSEEDDEGDGK